MTIPVEDLPIFQCLPKPVQDEINTLLPVFTELLNNGKSGIGCAIKCAAGRVRLSHKTVRTKYDVFRRDPCWRVLINKRRLGGTYSKVPSVFIPFWHGLIFENKRNIAKAYEKLCELWVKGEPIDGFPPAGERPAQMPEGLSKRNLYQKPYKPTKAQIMMARQGIAAARAFLPNIPQDVSEVRFLEYIVFDDVELDFLVIVPGWPQGVKIRLIVAMDLCSRVILGYGIRLAIPRADGTEDGLKLRDMKAVVARFLRTFGVPTEYQMHFICERATAAIPDATKAALAEISANMIVVHDTSMIVGQVFDFRDKASGNSWGKAWLESSFNPLHGYLADVEGQKGRRYDLAPAELEGRRKELATLVRAGRQLPIELRYQFRYPFKTVAEALQELDGALAKMHSRETHTLQGFDEIALWRINEGDKPKAETELPDYLIGQPGLLWTTRVETPMERLRRKMAGVARTEVHDSSLQRLMDEHTEVRFQNYQFAFTYQRVDYVYVVPEQLIPLLHEGEKYLLWFHSQDMAVVYVTRSRPHLGYIGKLGRFTRVRRGDLEDAVSKMKEKTRVFNHAKDRLQDAGLKKIHQRADDLEHNTAVINEALENAHALEMEVDVVTPAGASSLVAGAPDSVLQMTQEITQRIKSRSAAAKRKSEASKQAKNDRFSRLAEIARSKQSQTQNP